MLSFFNRNKWSQWCLSPLVHYPYWYESSEYTALKVEIECVNSSFPISFFHSSEVVCVQKTPALWGFLTFQKHTITSLYTIAMMNWNAWYFLASVEEARQDIESDNLNLKISPFASSTWSDVSHICSVQKSVCIETVVGEFGKTGVILLYHPSF